METFFIRVKCEKCGCDSVRLSKKVTYKDESCMITQEVYNHDDWGWDLNNFDIVCAECGDDEIKIDYKSV